ncbi:Fc receptor-like protein 5 isoform X2 [Polyodon spathula]|uniref:Fc receptor-like protein 5 isoform X2 n=1 Tax=Polyodon spathula TaxID=7913 RepID=UPI001B7DAF61|nr:Fc receptor-like protein 5 isoform X2 [Polyodon spathula]
MERTRIYQSLLFIVILQQGAPTFESNPLKIVGMKTRQVTLYCESLLPNSPHGTHQCWYYKGSRIFCGGSPVPSRFDGRLSQGESCNLVISNLVEEDSGPYTYVSSSGYFGDVNLNVTNVPMVTSFLPYIEGVRGRSVILPCLNYPSEQPLLQRQNCWYHETTDIYCFSSPQSNTSRFTSRLIASNDNNLKISELQMSDAGRFTCFLGQSNYGKLKLTVKDVPVSKPVITKTPSDSSIRAGTSISLSCKSSSGSWPISYNWYKLNSQSGRYEHFASGGTLTLNPAEVKNTGLYNCKASNQVNGVTVQESADSELSVQSPITNISLLAIPKQLFVFEGQTLTLRCQVDSGSPPINWTWHRYTEDSKQPDSEFRHQQQQELKLTHTEQSSVYSCSASNNCLGQVTTLQSEKVKVFIVPRPVAHAISYWSLALSLCALIVLAVVLILRRKTTPPPSPPKKTLQPISTKAHPPPNTKQNVRGNAKTNVYQDSHQDNEKDFYCPLSSDTCTGEDVYDELV